MFMQVKHVEIGKSKEVQQVLRPNSKWDKVHQMDTNCESTQYEVKNVLLFISTRTKYMSRF